MSISIYYRARRPVPMSEVERNRILDIMTTAAVDGFAASWVQEAQDVKFGEGLCLYQPDSNDPEVIIDGSTTLPSESDHAAWIATQFWCMALSSMRVALPDAEWEVKVEDHQIEWDRNRRVFDPQAEGPIEEIAESELPVEERVTRAIERMVGATFDLGFHPQGRTGSTLKRRQGDLDHELYISRRHPVKVTVKSPTFTTWIGELWPDPHDRMHGVNDAVFSGAVEAAFDADFHPRESGTRLAPETQSIAEMALVLEDVVRSKALPLLKILEDADALAHAFVTDKLRLPVSVHYFMWRERPDLAHVVFERLRVLHDVSEAELTQALLEPDNYNIKIEAVQLALTADRYGLR